MENAEIGSNFSKNLHPELLEGQIRAGGEPRAKRRSVCQRRPYWNGV
jgi:hypothetical protein